MKKLNFVAQRFLEKANKRKILSDKEKEHGFEWLKIAKDDLKASKILHQNQLYPLSVYHLQQFYEKLSKGFFILTGTINSKRIKSHKYTQKELDRLFKEGYYDDLKLLLREFDLNELNVNMETLNEIKEKNSKYKNLPEEDYQNTITIFAILEKILHRRKFVNSIKKKMSEKKTIRKLKYFIQSILKRGFRIRNSEVQKHINKKTINREINYLILATKTMLFAITTSYHEVTTRYPDKDEINYFSYKENFGLVKAMPKILEFSEQLLKEYQNHFPKKK